jgi:hypothetical protein
VFHGLTNRWPKRDSGLVHGAPAERWSAINVSLAQGHRERTGHWPQLREWRTEISGSGGETWGNVSPGAQQGFGRASAGSSLWDLPTKHRRVRNINNLPPLTTEQILSWADAFRAKHGV